MVIDVLSEYETICHKSRLVERNITRNPIECSSCVSSFEYLGYLVDRNSFKPDIKRLVLLTNEPSARTLTELRSLLGALNTVPVLFLIFLIVPIIYLIF